MISKKTIIISVIIIVLLAGSYFLIDFMGRETATDKPGQENESSAIDSSSASMEPIFEADKDSIVSIAITNSKESYEFVRSDNGWNVKGNEDILYNQAIIGSLSLDYVEVTPVLLVEENSANSSSFGFDSPLATSVVKTSDGKTAKFYLGDKTKGGNGYYFMMDGDEKIYTISTVLGSNMLKTLDEFRDKALVNIDSTSIKEVKMSVVGVGDVTIKRLDEQLDVTTSWSMTEPYNIGVYDERFMEYVITPMLEVQASVFLADNPTEEQITETGLDNPALFYEITTDNEKIRVDIGKNYNGEFAVKRADKPAVYLVNSSVLSFLYSDILDYVHSYAYLPNHEDVTEVVCDSKSGRYVLSKTADEYFVNDNIISDKKYVEYYQKLFDIKIQGIITAPADDPDNVGFSYTVNKKDGTSDKISFINVNSKFAYMSINDKMNFYVYNEAVENASKAMEELYEYSKNPVDEDEFTETDDVPSGFNWLALIVAVLVILLIASFPVSLLLNSKKKK